MTPISTPIGGTVDVYREPQSHNGEVVRLRNVAQNSCLDSNGSGIGIAWMRGCNNGDYQRWEVFDGDNGTIIFKSWGAWTLGGMHTCLLYDYNESGWLSLGSCDRPVYEEWKVSIVR